MDENEFQSLGRDLERRGWTRNEKGGWTAPGRRSAVGSMEAGRSEQPPLSALERGIKKRTAGSGSVVLRISIVAYRRSLLDRDAVAFAAKPITDSIAASLGVDDDDPRVDWEYGQVRTAGTEGLVVTFAQA